jgi:amino-acid N-acetyltransferase
VISDEQRKFIEWFRQTAPYLHTHRGRLVVVRVGGEVLEGGGLDDFVTDLSILHSVGMRLVVVVGARPQIETRLSDVGGESEYHGGLRVTGSEAMRAVKEAAGYIRVEMEARLSMGLPNSPMAGSKIRVVAGNFVSARPLGVIDGVDLEMTGKVRRVDAEAVERHLDAGAVVLMTPIGYAASGEAFNLSSVDVAVETAVSLKADKLVLLHEAAPLPRTALTRDQAAVAVEASSHVGVDLSEVQVQALEAAESACRRGVERVHLVPRHLEGGLLVELYTKEGAGTLVSSSTFEDVRQATSRDVPGIKSLIEPLEESGALVPRTPESLLRDIRQFTVLERDGYIMACVALYAHVAERIGELACVAVHPEHRESGKGDLLLQFVERTAKARGLDRLFVLTTQSVHWFQERGFEPGDLTGVPQMKLDKLDPSRGSRSLYKSL